MIDLLREQLYHQQMCIARDVSFNDDDEVSSVPSTSVSVDGSWAGDISRQMEELKQGLRETQDSHRQELRDRISEVNIYSSLMNYWIQLPILDVLLLSALEMFFAVIFLF